MNVHLRLLCLLPLAALVGCSKPPVQPLMPTPLIFTELGIGPLDHIPAEERWKPRRVYFATTREREDDQQIIEYNNKESDQVAVGMALIGFGGPGISWSDLNRYSREAKRDQEVPLSIAGLMEVGGFTPGASAGISENGSVKWLINDLNTSIESARDRDLMIYVHGAKVNFYNACVFAAQLDHFMGRDMTSLAFAWPTRQNIFAYGTGGDVRRAYRHADALGSLLETLAEHSKARRIHIVAWSAGGRLVTRALHDLHDRHAKGGADLRQRFRLGTVYLAAADVPGDEFIDALPALNNLASRLVVTASDNDGALRMGKRLMGGETRIGTVRGPLDPTQDTIVRAADRLEVINMSLGSEARGFDIDGHRYWFDHPWASSDLILAVRSDLSAAERALKRENYPVLWSVPADYPKRLKAALTKPGIQIRKPAPSR